MRTDCAIGWRLGRSRVKMFFWCDSCGALHGPTKRSRCGAPRPDAVTIFGEASPEIIEAAKTGASVAELVAELRASLAVTPVLPACRYKNRHKYEHLIVHCKWCRAYHRHGADPGPGQANGHRCSHCYGVDTPYHRTGYTLREVGVATPEVIKDLKRRRARGVQPATGRI